MQLDAEEPILVPFCLMQKAEKRWNRGKTTLQIHMNPLLGVEFIEKRGGRSGVWRRGDASGNGAR
jgi:hypothetical protein